MNIPAKVIAENLIFDPWFFIAVLLLLILLPPYTEKQRRVKLRRVAATWILLLVLSSTPFYQFFSMPLKQWIPENQKRSADVIVVASAGIHESGAPSIASAIRAHAAAKLYLEGLAPVVLVTGGVKQRRDVPSAAKGMAIILRGMGIPEENIIIEDQSIDTFQNGINTAKILEEQQLKTILLVSHDYHLPRLMGVFEKLGFAAHPYAANTLSRSREVPWWQWFSWKNFNRLQTISHEYVGLLIYRITGRI